MKKSLTHLLPLLALILIASCDELLVRDISGETIEIISPAAEAPLTVGNVSFSWESMEYADHYRLILVSPSFSDAQLNLADTILNVNMFRLDSLTSGSYQWRLQAFNSEYETAPHLSSFTIMTADNITDKPLSVVAPKDGAEISSENVMFSWEPLPGAENYRAIVTVAAGAGESGRVVADTTLTECAFSKILEDGDYSWRLQAFSAGYASIAHTYSFSVRTVADISGHRVRTIAPGRDARLDENDVAFSWEPLAGAENYRVTVAGPSFAEAKTILADTILQGTIFRMEIPDGDYQWRIIAANKSYESIPEISAFSVSTSINLSGDSVTVIAPAQGAELKQSEAVFLWDSLTGAENYKITVVSPSFSNPQWVADDATTIETIHRLQLPDGEYQWRITAFNSTSQTSPQTYGFSVNTGTDISGEQVEIIAPAPDIVLDNGNVAFAWEPLAGATSYRLTVVSPSFGNVRLLVDDVTVTETIVRMTLEDGDYQWRIQALNDTSATVPQIYSLSVITETEEEEPQE